MIATTPALFSALANAPVMAGTNLLARNMVAQEGAVHDFLPGEWVVREGDEGHAFFILVEGEVEVIKHAATPRETKLAHLAAGEIFGEMSVVDPVPRAASIRTLTAVRVIEIPAATLHHLYQKMPEQYAIVLLNLARDVARRLREIDDAYAARAG